MLILMLVGRQWLGLGDDYAHGLLGYASRQEKSDGLGAEAIEKELDKCSAPRPR